MIPAYHYIFRNIQNHLPDGWLLDYHYYWRDIDEHESAYAFHRWCKSNPPTMIQITVRVPKTETKAMTILEFRYTINQLLLANGSSIANAIVNVWSKLK